MSTEYEQQNGVPQGAVLSVLLFALKINGIAENLPRMPGFMFSLFVDDLQLGFRHTDLQTTKCVLQNAVNQLELWTRKNGFRFSASKTKIVHFTRENQIRPPPPLKIGNQILSYSTSAKFLGILFDSRLAFKMHLTTLKTECQKLLGVMKMVSAQEFGATEKFLLQVYRTYLRAKLDYGSIVYSSASPVELKKLDVVTNDALRIATGAFRSSPVESLYVIAEEMKPSERREYLTVRYYLKLKASLSNPTSTCITNRNLTLARNNNQHPFIVRCTDIQSKYNLPRFLVKPDFSYLLQNCIVPSYAIPNPLTNQELSRFPKESTSPLIYKQHFLQMKREKYHGFHHIYTDGSKSSDGVGAAAVSSGPTCIATLPKEATIYSAEVHAIQMAVDHVHRTTLSTNLASKKFVIFSDSKSAIQSLHNRNNHPVIRYLVHKLYILNRRSIHIEICWIPSHTGILGNDAADVKAKHASSRRPEPIPIYYKDYHNTIRSKFFNMRNELWQNNQNPSKLRIIKPDLSPFPILSLKRREQTIINRLRIGHTNMTHGYLMDANQPRIPPVCPYCNETVLTIQHTFSDCGILEQSRHNFFGRNSLGTILGSTLDVVCLFGFLRENRIFGSI